MSTKKNEEINKIMNLINSSLPDSPHKSDSLKLIEIKISSLIYENKNGEVEEILKQFSTLNLNRKN